MRTALAGTLVSLFASLALPGPAAATPAEEPAPAGEKAAVPVAAGPGEVAPAPVPAVDTEADPAREIAGPTGSVPAMADPAVEPLPMAVGPTGDLRHEVAFAPEVVFPFGDWADLTDAGFGLELAYAYRATDRLNLTGRLGYIVHLEEEKWIGGAETELHTHEIPVLLGVRYAPFRRFYGALEAGPVYLRYQREVNHHVETGGFRLGGAVGLGYRLDTFDVAARLFLPDLVGREDGVELSRALALQVGYTFASF